MRMMKTGGFTPCDRRLDRRKVALAAVAAFFIFATSAQAGIVDYKLDASQSYIRFTMQALLNATAPNPPLNFGVQPNSDPQQTFGGVVPWIYTPMTGQGPFPNDSMLSHFSGNMQIDMGVGTIRMAPQSTIFADTTANNYSPGRNFADVPAVGPTAPGNYGFIEEVRINNVPVGAAVRRYYDMQLDNRAANTARPLSPAGPPGVLQFTSPGSLVPTNGGSDYVNNLLGVGSKTALKAATGWGPNGFNYTNLAALPGTLDTATGHLIIPVFSQAVFAGLNGIPTLMISVGQLVMDPVVPEPSTVTLFGVGVIGLLAYARRYRQRRA